MTSLLDANILIDAGKVALLPKLIAACPRARWQVTREVFDELTSVPGRSLLTPLIRPSPLIGTPEAATSQALMAGGNWQKLGVGESSCIAAGIYDGGLEFVTWDKGSAWRSLHELRGRTVVGHDWLRRIVDIGGITALDADAVVRADAHRRHPQWW